MKTEAIRTSDSIARFQSDLADYKRRLESKEGELSAALSSFTRVSEFNQQQTGVLSSEKQALMTKIDALSAQHRKLEEELTAAKAEAMKLVSELNMSKHRVESSDAERDSLRQERNAIQTKYLSLFDDLQSVRTTLDQSNKDMVNARAEAAKAREEWVCAVFDCLSSLSVAPLTI